MNWRGPRGKMIRLWCFGSVCWMVGIFVIVLFFDPYGSRMDDDEVIHMYMVMLIPPLLIGLAQYVYKKYIR